MRIVALFTLTLLLAVSTTIAAPLDGKDTGRHDQCDNKLYPAGGGDSCVRFTMSETPAPTQVTEVTGKYVFLWMGDTATDSESTVTGNTALIGVLYADTNAANGLQRGPVPVVAPVGDDTLLI